MYFFKLKQMIGLNKFSLFPNPFPANSGTLIVMFSVVYARYFFLDTCFVVFLNCLK